jgi:hypothetical protein
MVSAGLKSGSKGAPDATSTPSAWHHTPVNVHFLFPVEEKMNAYTSVRWRVKGYRIWSTIFPHRSYQGFTAIRKKTIPRFLGNPGPLWEIEVTSTPWWGRAQIHRPRSTIQCRGRSRRYWIHASRSVEFPHHNSLNGPGFMLRGQLSFRRDVCPPSP